MFWQANKWGVLALILGLATVGGLYYYYLPKDELIAERIFSTGICAVLFLVGLATFLSARK